MPVIGTYRARMRAHSRALLLEYLERSGWNVTIAADFADMDRRHMHKLMQAHRIVRPHVVKVGSGKLCKFHVSNVEVGA